MSRYSSLQEVKKVAKLLLGRGKGYNRQLSSEEGVLELSVVKGRYLVPKDSNGQSCYTLLSRNILYS